MRRKSRKTIFMVPVLLGILLLFGCGIARADSSGSAGDSVTYSFDSETGTLTISGTGAMDDYGSGSSISTGDIPWYSCRDEIKSIVIESGVTYIGFGAFYGCDAETVAMADTVTSMGYGAFDQCNALVSVRLSENLTEIPDYCFYNDYSLTSVTIPASVTKIGSSAFYFCEQLTRVTIPASVTEIGTYAFRYANALASVTIPSTVTVIGSDAFTGTAWLENTEGQVIAGDGYLLAYNGTETAVTVSDGVKYISDSAFSGNESLTSVVLPASVVSIGAEAFYGLEQLEEVVIPESVAEIGADAFTGTAFLDDYEGDFFIVGDGILLKYKGNDENVVIPDGVKQIASEAIYLNLTVRSIVVPEGVEKLDELAIAGCARLNSLQMPSTVVELGKYCIGYYYSEILSGSVTLLSDSYLTIWGADNEAVSEYCENAGKTYIPESAFSGTVTDGISYRIDPEEHTLYVTGKGAIPDNTYPWLSCASLIRHVVIGENITSVGQYCFKNLGKAVSVSFPSTLMEIGNRAFYSCTGLTEVTLPKSATSVSYTAFMNCSSLKQILVEEGNPVYSSEDGILYNAQDRALILCPQGKKGDVRISTLASSIGNYAFYSCTLDSITLPETVTSVSQYAFYYCTLDSITLPETVTAVSNYAFYYCHTGKYVFEGAVPSELASYFIYPYSRAAYGGSIRYPEENEEWEEKAAALSGTFTAFTFLSYRKNDFASLTELTVSADESVSLPAGNGCLFCSDNPAVACVTEDGVIWGLKPGNAVITITDPEENAVYTVSVTVEGDDSEAGTKLTGLSEAIAYDNSDQLYVDAINTASNGYYYLLENELHLISLSTCRDILLYTFPNTLGAYVADDLLYVLDSCGTVRTFSLTDQVLTGSVEIPDFSASAIGVDGAGNIYVYGKTGETPVAEIRVYDKTGTLLSSADSYTGVSRFAGFDSENGNFYTESCYNWRYWGYNHDTTAVMAGRFTGGELTFSNTVVSCGVATSLQDAFLGVGNMVLYQRYYYDHQRDAELLGNKYLVSASQLYGRVFILVSGEYEPSDNSYGGSMYISRSGNDPGTERETQSVGVLAAFNSKTENLILYRNECRITEINPENGEVKSEYTCSYPLFSMKYEDGMLYLLEKSADGDFYVETVVWDAPDTLETESSLSLRAYETAELTVTADSSFTGNYTFSSSDNSVASVTSDGKVIAWKEGQAIITVSWEEYGLSTTCTVTVTEKEDLNETSDRTVSLSGNVTSNLSKNNYTVWSSPVTSYLQQLSDGSYERVQYLGSSSLLVEHFTKDGTLLYTKTLAMPLSLFGGFYHTEDANYVLVGQKNEEEDDSLEVMRLICYSDDWEELGSCSFTAINTYIPFDAGSCRMVLSDGLLYIYTCHEMYLSSDGYHHQANMTFVVDTDSLTVKSSYYGVMNNSYGYVSHSFNQFIASDGTHIVRMDHGDAYPRGIYLSVINAGESITSPYLYGTLYGIDGTTGANATGVSLGGMALGDGNVISVMNSVDMENYTSAYAKRNIYVLVHGLDGFHKLTQLTDYASDSSVTVRTPELVQLDESHFLVMWEEYDSTDGSVVTKLRLVDSDGNICSDTVSMEVRLSDCQPFVDDEGMVVWYVSDGTSATLYRLNPYSLTEGEVCPESVRLDKTSVTLEIGETAAFTASVLPAGASQSVVWSSGNRSVAAVDAYGTVTAVGTGVAVIRAAAEDGSCYASATVYVREEIPQASAGSDTQRITGLVPNGKYTINGEDFTASAEGTIPYGYEWSDTTVTIIRVNSVSGCNSLGQRLPVPHIHSYRITEEILPDCVTEGETVYECECGAGYTILTEPYGHSYGVEYVVLPTTEHSGLNRYTCSACGDTYDEVIRKITLLWFDAVSVTLPTETEYGLTVYGNEEDNRTLVWSSDNESVATVDENGVVTAKRYGTAKITVATDDGYSMTSIDINTLFRDVAGTDDKTDKENYQYYFRPVYWAAEEGITTGYDGVYFGVGRNCTRAEVMIFLWRTAGCPAPEKDAGNY